MKRIWILAAAGLAATTAVVVLAASGSAQTTGGRTLTFFESNKGSTFHFVDNPPKSFRRNVVSVGDEVIFTNPVYDHRGGKRIGTLYAEGTFVKGRTPNTGLIIGHGVFKIGGGSIVGEGVFRSTDKPHTNTVAVIGGTGAYEGARGQFTSVSGKTGSNDTVHLLP